MRTVLVTGGAKRLGAAIVRRLAADGHAVVVHQGHSPDEAAALVAEIVDSGGQAAAVAGDLSDLGAIDDLFAAARAAIGGPIDGLVNCASKFEFDRPPTVDPVLFAELGAINCGAPVLLASALASQDDVADGAVYRAALHAWDRRPPSGSAYGSPTLRLRGQSPCRRDPAHRPQLAAPRTRSVHPASQHPLSAYPNIGTWVLFCNCFI